VAEVVRYTPDRDKRIACLREELETVLRWLKQPEVSRWPEFTVQSRVESALDFERKWSAETQRAERDTDPSELAPESRA
jgi:hypothetical protein